MSQQMQIYKLNEDNKHQRTKVYVDNFKPITVEDIELEFGEIEKQDKRDEDRRHFSLRMWTHLKVHLTNKKYLEILKALVNRNDQWDSEEKLENYVKKKYLSRGFGHMYNYRGRGTDKAKKRADKQAREALKKEIKEWDEEEFIESLNGQIQEKIEHANRSYIEEVLNRCRRRDNFPWDEWKTDTLKEVENRIDEVDKAIDRLEDRRHRLREVQHTHEHDIFLNNFDGYDDVPPEANEAIRSEAEEEELFSKRTGGLFS